MNNLGHGIENNLEEEDTIDWELEATAIIRDVQNHVKEISISKNLRSNNFQIYLNIETLETQKYCVRVSSSGFQIVGNDYDKNDLELMDSDQIFETPYALLTSISQKYVESFANRLSSQIENALRQNKD